VKKKRFSEEQIIAVLKEAEAGAKVLDLCRKHGISDATFDNWKAKYGGMTVAELEAENAKLKRIVADQALRQRGAEGPSQSKVVSPQARREAVGILTDERGLGVTRACGLVGISRSLYRYRSRRSPALELRGRIAELAAQKRRYGYRRIPVLLRR
jgi:putative transposase